MHCLTGDVVSLHNKEQTTFIQVFSLGAVLCISYALCYFIHELMKACCLDPQIRRPPGTSVLLTLCLSATSPAAAPSQRV